MLDGACNPVKSNKPFTPARLFNSQLSLYIHTLRKDMISRRVRE